MWVKESEEVDSAAGGEDVMGDYASSTEELSIHAFAKEKKKRVAEWAPIRSSPCGYGSCMELRERREKWLHEVQKQN